MIDVPNYKRAIAWLRRAMLQLDREPQDELVLLDIRHRMQVTYNLSELVLRQAYVEAAKDDEIAQWVSLRELFRRAEDESLLLSTKRNWLEYGLLLEDLDDQFLKHAALTIPLNLMPQLTRYADELEAFASALEERLARVV